MLPCFAYMPGGGSVVVAAPTLASVSTAGGAVGDIAGAYAATLTGTAFTGATGVTFGGTAATSVVVVSATTITCVVPARPTGASSVIVTTPGGSNVANTAFRYFSLAELTISGYWRAPFSASPWTPTSSAGASGTNGSLAEVTNPPVTGTAVNGFVPAAFNGTTHVLTNASALASMVTDTAGSLVCLFNATTAIADPGSTSSYLDPSLISSGTSRLQLGFSAAGVRLSTFNGTAWDGVAAACGTAAWHLAQARWNSTTIEVRVDGGAWQTLARTIVTAGGSVQIGKNYDLAFLAGKILETATCQSRLSDATFDDMRSYVNTRYALAL